ncbi:MAG: aminotransferase class I/II-fold pyridoxal phosphate-dependent enzyme [Actinomycetota bacterium]
MDPKLFDEFGMAATATQRFTYGFDAPLVLMLDADVLCTGSLDELFEQGTRSIAGVTAYVWPHPYLKYRDGVDRPRASFWPELFRFAGLPTQPLVSEYPGWKVMEEATNRHSSSSSSGLERLTRRFCPPYFNLGVLAASSETIERLGTTIFDDLATVNRFCTAVHRCQLALTLAMVRTATRPVEMPLRFNFPNDPGCWEEYPDEAADIRILHYMRSKEVDRDVFRASPERLRDFLQRREISPVNSFMQSQVAELGDTALGIDRPSPQAEPEPRLRFVRPLIPSSEKWVPFLVPAYASGWFSNHGPVVQRFERELQERCGIPERDVAVVSSATSGLVATLIALRVQGPVAMPAFTFPATAHAVRLAGCTPVFCDIDPDTWELDPGAAAEAIEAAGCVAIIHVRAFGLCRDTSQVEALAARVGVPLILDSAAAFGGHTEGGPALGAGGAAEVFSFHATKPFGIGEGGAVLAPPSIAQRVREVINFDLVRGEPRGRGLNAKMSEFTAAIGLAMLADFDSVLATRREACARLTEIAEQDDRTEPPARAGRPPWQCFPMKVAEPRMCQGMLDALANRGVEARILYQPALHRTTAFKQHADRALPVTEDLTGRILCLPVYADLSDREAAMLNDTLDHVFRVADRSAMSP